jgi:integrase
LLAGALAQRNFIIRKTLSDKGVAALKPRPVRYAHSDPEQRGGFIRVQPSGAKSYWAVARNPRGKQVWTLVGVLDGLLKIDKARDTADIVVKRIRAGLPAFESPPTTIESFKAVAEVWLKRHVQAKALLSGTEVRQRLEKHIYPRWQATPFVDIRRADVADLLDAIEDGFGPRAADHVLELVRRIMNWYATRHDDYVSPLVRGMRRWNPTEHARARILDDDEIRAVWKAAADNGTFGALARLALLTASRRDKLASMKWVDISEDGLWSFQWHRVARKAPPANSSCRKWRSTSSAASQSLVTIPMFSLVAATRTSVATAKASRHLTTSWRKIIPTWRRGRFTI